MSKRARQGHRGVEAALAERQGQGWRLAAAALFHSYALRGRGAATGG
eukprot:gene2762-4456_t